MLIEDYEDFTDHQRRILEKYVTNTRGQVFVLRNLPEVIKGALFSRYSRSSLGLRTLLLKEFISDNEEADFSGIVGDSIDHRIPDQAAAIKKAQSFYDRILDGYGDDSIGELGGAHLAVENISLLGAQNLEDARIGGSPLEKSTRYIYFDQKVKGEYLFYREPILMTSAYRDIYTDTCNMLFETYSKLIPPLTTLLDEKQPKDPNISKTAYTAALRAKVLDCLRGLLPAGTMTNMGIFGNGRFFEQLLHKMHCHNLAEMQEIGKRMFEELSKVIPSFIRRSDIAHHSHQSYAKYYDNISDDIRAIAEQHNPPAYASKNPGVYLIDSDPFAPQKIAAALLYGQGKHSLEDLLIYCKHQPEEEINRILDAASLARESRRHKSPRALEQSSYTFEIIADFGVYRDLHRHRLVSQERQLFNCDYGFYVPQEILHTPLEKDYIDAMHKAKEVYETIASELPEEAQYVVPIAYNVRWYLHTNLRALQWLCELRSQPAGHPNYRLVAQSMAKQVIHTHPQLERFFKFVDFRGYEMGRIYQEQRKADKAILGLQ